MGYNKYHSHLKKGCVAVVGANVHVPINDHDQHFILDGILTIPNEQEENSKKGIVVFAHGSGSGRHSPRNQYVSSILNNSGIGTLLVDLLTKEEQEIDEKTREYRFNIKLLANRLSAITDWLLVKNSETQNFAVGYFGASTGAAAALMTAGAAAAATDRSTVIKAIVSRGGRPDLAGSSYLKQVQAPTLLIVGSNDNTQVIALNQKSLQQLKNVKEKRLVMVPGAGHLLRNLEHLKKQHVMQPAGLRSIL